ncbi:MAG: bifunctional 3,4-dihydroxy-2-butanone-4-phosphate synthase/GTP cyclohydrolase II [Odoribacteraceae bacterium]|jgi:3,4-dihydroxy 2-butanone 4-phosphate synthase/GTP cyclohydrolase II|nr:bifunctional 3,4-dihydroxy-2-butanone-4-phosphate synthase/GTP cyclohydrolase II [Odoribacteraceae bacterium]
MGEFVFNTIEEAIADIRAGKMIVVVDDEDRENEGDLLVAAEKATPEAVNFMIREARGIVCMPVTKERLDELNIDMMVATNTDKKQTAFTVSIDAVGCTTGVSAFDRALTIRRVLDPAARPSDFTRPGHVFPLIARSHGVLMRAGHTEAAVDLARAAGLYPAGVICEVMNEDGSMARVPDLARFTARHHLKMITIADLITYRRSTEMLVERVTEVELPTKYGHFRACGYVNKVTGEHHVALVKGDLAAAGPVLCRVHSECLTGDAFGSLRCDCGDQLQEALRRVERAGRGVVLYMRQEGRGIGLINKLRAYGLQDAGMDTVEANLSLGFKADLRDYGIGAEILADLGVREMVLMTNNPLKISGLEGYGIKIVGREPIEMTCNEKNAFYLYTKYKKMGHMLHVKEIPDTASCKENNHLN